VKQAEALEEEVSRKIILIAWIAHHSEHKENAKEVHIIIAQLFINCSSGQDS
jgi:hypothetical protein